jgi:adenosylmethionine---8-amino-7-oxononanoate aminotransferase
VVVTSRDDLVRDDLAYIWHPFTQMKGWLGSEPLVIQRGEGSYLFDVDGTKYIDGVSSLWVTVHGHREPTLDEALREQIDRISHSTTLGLTNVPAIELARELVHAAPAGLTKVFFSESGASAVEVAVKMAFQFWRQSGRPSKQRFVSFENAYHGDTLGAVSVGGIETFHEIFRPLLFDTFRAASPYCYRCPLGLEYPSCEIACLSSLETILSQHADGIAAVILEPVMQGAAGMIAAPAGHLSRVRELCDRHDVLLILDEVATGVGRTGHMWACERESVSPDLMCAGKGISGGYLPISATFASQRIFDAFLGDSHAENTFFHGHTYSGNPLAAAVSVANLRLMRERNLLGDVQRKAANLADHLKPIAELPHVGDVRQRGFMTGIELVADRATKEPYPPSARVGWRVIDEARRRGVIIRPLGDVVVLMPPLGIDDQTLEELVRVTGSCIADVTGT